MGVLYTYPYGGSIPLLCGILQKGGLYICISVGLSVARFDLSGNAKAF